MKYGIRKEEKICEAKWKWKNAMENEVDCLKNQIAILNGQLLNYSNRLSRLEKTNALKEVQSRAKISAIQHHKNAKRHEFTPKLFGSFSQDIRGVDTQHYQTFHLGDDFFEKKSTNPKHPSGEVFGSNFSSEFTTRPKINVNIFPKPGEESPKIATYPNSKQEDMLTQVLTQLGKMDSKMTDVNEHITSVDFNLSEISSRLSVMDSRLSAVDMFITMQRFNQKWQGLEPKLDSLNGVEKLPVVDCEVEVISNCNKAGELKNPDEKCPSLLIDKSLTDAEVSLNTNEKGSSPETRTAGDEIKLKANDACSTLSNASSLFITTPVVNNKVAECAVDFKEDKTNPLSPFNDRGLKKQLQKKSMCTSVNSGIVNIGNGNERGEIKEKNNAKNEINDDDQQRNVKVQNQHTDIKLENGSNYTDNSTNNNPNDTELTSHTDEPKKENNKPNENLLSDPTDDLDRNHETKQSDIQTGIDNVQTEGRIRQVKAKGSGGTDLENIQKSCPEDSEDDFVIVSKSDIQEITRAEISLATNNDEPIKMYHDITEYLEINMGKKKNEVYEFGFEAKDDSFLNFKDNMVTNDSKSVKQSSPALQHQIHPVPIPTTQISSEIKVNATGKENQGRPISHD